ncbi:MAG TPA: VOC family protein [Actinomycetota bacterium]
MPITSTRSSTEEHSCHGPSTLGTLRSHESLVLDVRLDRRDAGAVAQFWEAVTGHPKEQVHQPGNDHWVVSPPDGTLPRLVFVTVPQEKSIKDRMHLDLLANHSIQEDEVALG